MVLTISRKVGIYFYPKRGSGHSWQYYIYSTAMLYGGWQPVRYLSTYLGISILNTMFYYKFNALRILFFLRNNTGYFVL